MNTDQMRSMAKHSDIARLRVVTVIAADEIDALRARVTYLDGIATEAAESCNQYALLNANLLARFKEQEWQPIETAPRDGTRILMRIGTVAGSGCFRCARPWDVCGRDFYFDGCDMPSTATHWRPLPPTTTAGSDG